ncbi:condensation domain-containing protein [Kribbella sp. NBC_01505]|uniref:condensation domain-containing protein n=1 Tax=Kribbella sp. NBC_01505 TaxID=2903580 RepID=UPI003866D9B2
MTGPQPSIGTIVNIARAHAATRPDRPAYVFLENGEVETGRWSFATLDVRARAVAAELQRQRLAGQRVLIAYPSGLAYVEAFLGCLYAGVVAVPADSPQVSSSRGRLAAIRADCSPAAVLAATADIGVAGLANLRGIDVCAIPDDVANVWRDPRPGGNDLAFLQYTSGSTRTPRGVMVNHHNIVANERLIATACGHDESSTFVGWQPMFHDMGLVANIMQPLFLGSLSVLMPPQAFLHRPIRWLRAISRYRANTSGGPNFAYAICADKTTEDERAGLDLRDWRVAFNSAEPIRAATLRRFTEEFSSYGFDELAHFPCYGLAEATLLVTGPPRDEPPRIRSVDQAALRTGQAVPAEPASATSLVSCGSAGLHTELRIVDPKTSRECAAHTVGEIWIAGPAVAQGYWGSPADEAATFGAQLAGLPEQRFLRTGDLGCVVEDELYVTGRRKDMIVLRGQNHAAEDLELTAERAHDALRPGSTAAFGLDTDGTEFVLLCCELRSYTSPEAVAKIAVAVYDRILREHGVELHALVVLRRNGVPKTTSGKVRRSQCRHAYLTGRLPVHRSVPRERMAEPLDLPPAEELRRLSREGGAVRLTAALLNALSGGPADVRSEPAGPAQTLAGLGVNSLVALQLRHALCRQYQIDPGLATLLGEHTVGELAEQVMDTLLRDSGAPDLPPTRAVQPAKAGWLPLTHGQRALWFEQQLAPDAAAYHLARAVVLRGAVSEARLDQAVERVARRHPALSARFAAPGGEPRCQVGGTSPVLRWLDATAAPSEAFAEQLRAESERPFDLAAEPAARLIVFRRGPDERVLLLVAHHLVADFWSLVTLLRDLASEYSHGQGYDNGDRLLPATAGQSDLVELEHRAAQSSGYDRARRYWHHVLSGVPAALDLPVDFQRPAVRGFAGTTHRFTLPPVLTDRLRTFAASHGATLYTGLLAGYQLLLHRVTGSSDLVVGAPIADRPSPALADAVGYLVNLLPVRSRHAGQESFSEFLGQTAGSVLGGMEHSGYPYRAMVADLGLVPVAGSAPLVRTTFVLQREYGIDDDGFRAVALGVPGQLRLGELRMEVLPIERRWSMFDLSLGMAEIGDELVGVWEYRTDLFSAATIEALTGDFTRLLAAVVDHPDRRLDQIEPRVARYRRPPQKPAGTKSPARRSTATAATEQVLQRLWCASLSRAEVGAEQNFFVLGGDSIQALRLVAAAQEAGLPLTLVDLLRYPTVRALAERLGRLTQRGGVGGEPGTAFSLCPQLAGSADLDDAYPISLGQLALLFHQECDPGYEVYLTSIGVRARLDSAVLEAAVRRVVRRHPYLRSSFDLVSFEEPMQLVHTDLTAAFEVVDLRDVSEPARDAAVRRWLREESRRRFDTMSGPLVRFTAHDTGTSFRFTVSSFGLDGWSDTTLVAEVLSDYAAAGRGRVLPLAPPRSEYRGFVAAERAATRSAGHRLFWEEELAGARPSIVPRWPDYPTGATDASQHRHVVALEDALADRLRALAATLEVGLKHVLLAAHLSVVRALTGRDEVVTGVMANGRLEHPEGDRVVGLFNNAVPLRLSLGEGSWADLVRLAHRAELRVTPFRRYPLVEAQRQFGAARLFNTLFVYTHFHLYEQLLGGAELEVFDLHAPDQTYLPLTSHFNVDAWSRSVRLLLDFDPQEFSSAQVSLIGDGYLRALEAIGDDSARPCLDDLIAGGIR